jgi:reactive intermediate/imine deaminase
MSKTAITSPELTPPVGLFSQAIGAGGFLYFSGQVAQDPATGKLVEGGIVAETERVLQNLSAVLKAAGKSFDDVVRAGVFLTSMSDFAGEWHLRKVFQSALSRPHDDRGRRATAWGLRRDRPRRQSLRRRNEGLIAGVLEAPQCKY